MPVSLPLDMSAVHRLDASLGLAHTLVLATEYNERENDFSRIEHTVRMSAHDRVVYLLQLNPPFQLVKRTWVLSCGSNEYGQLGK